MGKIVSLKEKVIEKEFEKEGINPNRVIICMNPYEFSTIIENTLIGVTEGKKLDEIMQINSNLYTMGYLQDDEKTILMCK